MDMGSMTDPHEAVLILLPHICKYLKTKAPRTSFFPLFFYFAFYLGWV